MAEVHDSDVHEDVKDVKRILTKNRQLATLRSSADTVVQQKPLKPEVFYGQMTLSKNHPVASAVCQWDLISSVIFTLRLATTTWQRASAADAELTRYVSYTCPASTNK